ncbi:hypothetical protein GQ44DRAFT_771592 [Phaeosphaeriaceae sp. PMI808]|nr:hypothetical protein GQ44DRAFT_771592 [Phaeosphaeriaceae sp. PMI808]
MALPGINSNDVDNATFVGPIPSLQASTPSVAPTTSTESTNPYYISTPKPVITVGLAHDRFKTRHQRLLVDHQASGTILSDLHAADMGMRFPFLVFEAKGHSLAGSPVDAENQAAVSGACMLTIHQDLSSVASQDSPEIRFSIMTAGPSHQIWVHFRHEEGFHMFCSMHAVLHSGPAHNGFYIVSSKY